MKQMEEEDHADGGISASNNSHLKTKQKKLRHAWPIDFPRSFEYADFKTPLAKLEKAETDILKTIISAGDLRRIQVTGRS